MQYTVLDEHGQVLMRGSSMFLPAAPPGGQVLGGIAPDDTYRQGGEWIPIPPRPSAKHVFDWPKKQWVDPRTLDQLREERWVGVKNARIAFIAAGADVPGIGRFDADSDAITNLTATRAVLDDMPDDWTIAWTLHDNTVAVLSKADVRAAAAAVFELASQAHAIAQALRAQLNAATTAEQIEAVRWPA